MNSENQKLNLINKLILIDIIWEKIAIGISRRAKIKINKNGLKLRLRRSGHLKKWNNKIENSRC